MPGATLTVSIFTSAAAPAWRGAVRRLPRDARLCALATAAPCGETNPIHDFRSCSSGPCRPSVASAVSTHQPPQVDDMFVFGGRVPNDTRTAQRPSMTVGSEIRLARIVDRLRPGACARRCVGVQARRLVAQHRASAGAPAREIFQCARARRLRPRASVRVRDRAGCAPAGRRRPARGSRTRA